jgi:hypothetical protein
MKARIDKLGQTIRHLRYRIWPRDPTQAKAHIRGGIHHPLF